MATFRPIETPAVNFLNLAIRDPQRAIDVGFGLLVVGATLVLLGAIFKS